MKKNKYKFIKLFSMFFITFSLGTGKLIRVKSDTERDSGRITVSGNEYGNYFTPNGEATIISDVANLTPEINWKVGNTLLNTKINMNDSFSLKGEVNLGAKDNDTGGDGISFVFQPGDNNIIGGAGNAFGIGGLEGAFGFKLDTHFNTPDDDSSQATPDPSKFENADNGKPSAFGAFIENRTGQVASVEESAQRIEHPKSNEFRKIEIKYDGIKKMISVLYEGKMWDRYITNILGDNNSMSFGIAGSTGWNNNLQQFRLEKFDYVIAKGKVITYYKDSSGNFIENPEIQEGEIDSNYSTDKKIIDGYTFQRVEGNATGRYKVNDQIVTYIYDKNETPFKEYGVTFDTDGGSSVNSQTVTSGSAAKKPSDPTKVGYTFKEWQLNGVTYDFSQPVTSDITLKAVYTKNDVPVKEYDVTFDSDGGTAVHFSRITSKVDTDKNTTDLPQTGEKSEVINIFLGLMLIVIFSIYFTFSKYKTSRK